MSFFKYIRSARNWISSFGQMVLTFVFSSCQSLNKFGFGHLAQRKRSKNSIGWTASARPLDGRQLRRYIASMREVVEAYKKLRNSSEKTNKR